MLAHFIQRKGKGAWVVVLPMAIACVLFIFSSVLNLNDRYVGAITLLLSAVILIRMDTRREIISDGVIQRTGKMLSGKNTLMWIDVKYWAVFLGLWGLILLFNNVR